MKKTWLQALALAAFAAVVHAAVSGAYIDHPITYDEMYHYLAAQSLPVLGYPGILDGSYTRAYWYTYLVSEALPLCRGSLACLRSSSLLASSLLVFGTTLFACRYAGMAIGVLAGLMLAISPPLVFVGHYLRFYALHALLVFGAAAMVFAMTEPRPARSMVARAGAAAMLAGAALYLQVTTLVALAGIALATLVVVSPRLFSRLWLMPPTHRAAVGALMLFSIGATYWVADATDLIDRLRSGPPWSARLADYATFYHHLLSRWYPVAWGAVPLVVLAGVASSPRLVIYCTTVFFVSFAVMSAGYTKGVRFIAFAMPFLCIVLSAGVVAMARALRALLAGALASWSTGNGLLTRRHADLLASLAVVVAFVMSLGNQPLVGGALRAVTSVGYERVYGNYASYPHWRSAAPVMLAQMREPRVVVTTAGVIAAYVVGDFSFDLNASTMSESNTGAEFGIDPRTGRPTISSPDSVRTILATCGPGIAIIDRAHSEDPLLMPPATLALLESLGPAIEPEGSQIRIWTWDHHAAAATVGPDVPCRPIVGKGRIP